MEAAADVEGIFQRMVELQEQVADIEKWCRENTRQAMSTTRRALANSCLYWAYHELCLLRAELRLRWMHPLSVLIDKYIGKALPWQTCWECISVTSKYLDAAYTLTPFPNAIPGASNQQLSDTNSNSNRSSGDWDEDEEHDEDGEW
jgi:hypothetical protein